MEAVAIQEHTYLQGVSLRDRVNTILKEACMNKQILAMNLGLSRPMVSQYLNGKYQSDPTNIENRLREFVAHYEQTGDPNYKADGSLVTPPKAAEKAVAVKSIRPKIDYFESRDYLQVIGVCKACQESRAMGIVVAKSGFGKTHALKKYAKMPRVAYIECDDTMACRDLVDAIETQLGMTKSTGGTIWKRVNQIREFFNVNEGYLLIIDEADKLINKYTQKKMEIIRGIFDQSSVGIVIAGEPKLEADIKGSLARLANRTDFYYKLQGLTRQEVEDYLEGYDIESDALNEFVVRATNPKLGCFRLLDRTLSNVLRILRDSGETTITMKVVNQASSMMMRW